MCWTYISLLNSSYFLSPEIESIKSCRYCVGNLNSEMELQLLWHHLLDVLLEEKKTFHVDENLHIESIWKNFRIIIQCPPCIMLVFVFILTKVLSGTVGTDFEGDELLYRYLIGRIWLNIHLRETLSTPDLHQNIAISRQTNNDFSIVFQREGEFDCSLKNSLNKSG